MTTISLTTDFGLADGFVGIIKGVILNIAPDVRFVDLTHEIAPEDVRQAAYVLARAAPYFPEATIHLAVVDPGVGSARRPLLVTTERAAYVGPDNGIFSAALAEPACKPGRSISRGSGVKISRTFHGRDIFAPVAGHVPRHSCRSNSAAQSPILFVSLWPGRATMPTAACAARSSASITSEI